MALAGLALRAPKWIAILAGTPVVIAIAIADGRDSANPASAVLAVALGAGFLFGTSALTAFSRNAHRRAEALLTQEAAIREVREQMAAMAERSRLARELHDVLAHSLSGLAVQLEAARLLAVTTAADQRLVDQISSARKLAQSGLLDARRALQTLRQDEIPGPARLPYLVAETASALGIPVTLQATGTPRSCAAPNRTRPMASAITRRQNLRLEPRAQRIEAHLPPPARGRRGGRASPARIAGMRGAGSIRHCPR